jgi:anti-anti-sigma regulatory factor
VGELKLGGYTISREVVAAPEGCAILRVEGRRLDSRDAGALLDAIEPFLREGYDLFLFKLKLEALSAVAFYEVFKKLALYDARMAFIGVEDRLREAFDEWGLESFFAFAETVEEAIARCASVPSIDETRIGEAIDKAIGACELGLDLRFSRAPGLIGSLIVRVAGVLDERSVPAFEAKVRKAMEMGYPCILFDMDRTKGWSDQASASIALILRKALASEGTIALARLDPAYRNALKARAEHTAPRVFDSIEEGLEFIADGRSA